MAHRKEPAGQGIQRAKARKPVPRGTARRFAPVRAGKVAECKYIVGIGASAGGLEALRALFSALKTIPRMAFVVVQHLAPLHRSRLVELIAHATRLPVKEIRDGMRPEPGTIYITPPNADVYCDSRVLRLKDPRIKAGPKPSIDLFFRSLAENRGDRSIGIILSGTGSDGALGVRAIKSAGGITIAQKVETAKYDGMPKAAKNTGVIDLELSPEEIAGELSRFDKLDRDVLLQEIEHAPGENDPYYDILGVLEKRAGADFSGYKQSTIRRRMERRVLATRCETLAAYARYIVDTPGEAQLLFQNILISVTSFFRDSYAFKALSQRLLERVGTKSPGDSFRCWIAGCATGEEAYSIAILLAEAADKLKKSLHIQIFATDLDEHALALARKAVYPKASVTEVPAPLLEKYFTPVEENYQIRSSLRDTIVFARHNAAEDPPFLNLDLVSCRNVLIYFNARLQEQVFKTVHYALGSGGLLFLGKSEAVPASSAFFQLLDKKAKIHVRVGRRGEVPRPFTRQEATREAVLISQERDGGAGLELFNSVVIGLAPNSILVNDEYTIKHVFGQAGRYLSYRAGQVTQIITKLVPAEMALELTALLHRCQKSNATVAGRKHEFRAEGSRESDSVKLAVVPLDSDGRRGYLVCFESTLSDRKLATRRPKARGELPPAERIRLLEEELATTREHLQTVTEEQETSNEELQALNEELQSANEELQSSNEELETTNEELQSSNEELTTVNEELNVKSLELQMLNQRLQAIQGAIVYPLLIVDRNRHLVNFNPAARHLLRISDADIGSDLRNIQAHIELKDVIRAIDRALTEEAEPRMSFTARDRSFEVQVQLFRGPKGAVEGAVVSFVENTEIATALAESRLNRRKLSDILENTPAIVTMKDLSGVYLYANQRFSTVMGKEPQQIAGHTDEDLFGAAGVTLQEHDHEVARRRAPLEFTESFTLDGRDRIWTSSKFPLFDTHKRVQSICTVSLDITERVLHQQQLELFKRAISASNNGIILLEPGGGDFRTIFASEQLRSTIGLNPEDAIGAPLGELLRRLPLDLPSDELSRMENSMLSQETCGFTAKLADRPAESWIDLRSSLVQLDAGDVAHLILTVFDATLRIKDQRTIAHQQDELSNVTRFSALGEIASGIAHEINTPLNVISTKTSYLKVLGSQEKLEKAHIRAAALDIEKMVENVSNIVHGLTAVIARNPDKFETADLKAIVQDTAKICEMRLQRFGVSLRMDLPVEDIRLKCYPVQIIQILINLINNSIDAVADEPERWISVRLRKSGLTAELLVTDSGGGIDAGLAEKIFTPFFTTKRDQKGTGIGLSLSRSIARRHEGDLVLDLGQGNTAFRLALPLKQLGA